MTRPLAVTGFTMLFTLLVLSSSENKVIGAVLISALIAFVVFMSIKSVRHDKTLPTAAASVIIALLILLLNNGIYYSGARALAGKTVTVSGTLSSLPYENNGSNYYIIKADSIDGEKSNLNIRLVSKSPLKIEPTDRVTVETTLFLLGESDDDTLKYYKSKSLFLGGYGLSNLSVNAGACKNISTLILKLRQGLTNEILSLIPNSCGGLIAGLCFGDKTNIPRTVTTAFSAAGVSHLLAVSGLHLSVWSTLIYGLLRKMRVSQKISSVVSIIFIVFFAVLTGLNPPVIRAGAMLGLMFAANLFRREADSINSIGLSLVILLVSNPYMASSLSLWLSLLATVGMIIFLKPINKFLDKPIERVKNIAFTRCYKAVSALVAVSISVTVMTLPVFMISLPTVSVMTVFSNLLMVTAGSVCMTTGGLAAVALLINLDFIGKPLLFISGIISEYLIKLTSGISKLHYALIPVNSDFIRIVMSLILVSAAIILIMKIKKQRIVKYIAITLSAVMIISVSFGFAIDNSKLRVTVASVGNGTAVVLKYKGQTSVIGCGGEYFSGAAVCDIMSEYGSTNVDYLILPQNDSGCLLGVGRVAETYNIGKAYFADDSTSRKYSFANTYLLSGDQINIAKDELTVVPSKDNSYLTVTFCNFKAVIVFDGNYLQNDLSGNLLICQNSLPNGDVGNFDLIVLSSDDENLENPHSYGNIILTSQNGDVSFKINKDGKMKYRRAT